MSVGPFAAHRDPGEPLVVDARGGITAARAWGIVRALASRLPQPGASRPVLVACERRGSFGLGLRSAGRVQLETGRAAGAARGFLDRQ